MDKLKDLFEAYELKKDYARLIKGGLADTTSGTETCQLTGLPGQPGTQEGDCEGDAPITVPV